jgi:hypothetical protein
MTDLTLLQKKRRDYVKAQADKIANHMVECEKTTATLATCNASNWDTELHNAMSEIIKELSAMGINTTSSIHFGVTDWVFTIKS